MRENDGKRISWPRLPVMGSTTTARRTPVEQMPSPRSRKRFSPGLFRTRRYPLLALGWTLSSALTLRGNVWVSEISKALLLPKCGCQIENINFYIPNQNIR